MDGLSSMLFSIINAIMNCQFDDFIPSAHQHDLHCPYMSLLHIDYLMLEPWSNNALKYENFLCCFLGVV